MAYSFSSIALPSRGMPASETSYDKTIREFLNKNGRKVNDLAPLASAPTISMASLGSMGFGRSVLQYLFLRVLAQDLGLRIETPDWVGREFFGHDDPTVSELHGPVIFDQISNFWQKDRTQWHPYDKIKDLARHCYLSSGRSSWTISVNQANGSYSEELPFWCGDLRGEFAVHTKNLVSHKDYLQSLLEPIKNIKDSLHPAVERLKSKGSTVVGIHVRSSNLLEQTLPEIMGPTPIRLYQSWIQDLWEKLDNPILFICSDKLSEVLPHFSKFQVITADDLEAKMPDNSSSGSDVNFFPDWYLLSICDVVAISNSAFSFSSCLANKHAKQFFRPTFTDKALVPFNPWDSDPYILRPRRRFVASDLVLHMEYYCRAFGIGALPKGLLWALQAYVAMIKDRIRTRQHFFNWPRNLVTLFNPRFFGDTRYGIENDA